MYLNLEIPVPSIRTKLFIFIKERSNMDKYDFLRIRTDIFMYFKRVYKFIKTFVSYEKVTIILFYITKSDDEGIGEKLYRS